MTRIKRASAPGFFSSCLVLFLGVITLWSLTGLSRRKRSRSSVDDSLVEAPSVEPGQGRGMPHAQ